jgi:hypothetical protein
LGHLSATTGTVAGILKMGFASLIPYGCWIVLMPSEEVMGG